MAVTALKGARRPIREPVSGLEPESDVGYALKQLMQAVRQNMEAEVRRRGSNLSFAHALVLKTLAQEPGLSGAQVARRALVTAQTMNGLLRNLETSGCIVREANPENRRADRWFLTREGVARLEQGKAAGDEVVRRMLAPLSASDAARFSELLQKCTRALQPSTQGKESSPETARGSQRRR